MRDRSAEHDDRSTTRDDRQLPPDDQHEARDREDREDVETGSAQTTRRRSNGGTLDAQAARRMEAEREVGEVRNVGNDVRADIREHLMAHRRPGDEARLVIVAEIARPQKIVLNQISCGLDDAHLETLRTQKTLQSHRRQKPS